MQRHYSPQFPEDTTEYAPWVAKHGLYAPYGECQCGCQQPAPISTVGRKKAGFVKGQPIRFIFGHQSTGTWGIRKSLQERFWEKVDKRGPDDCWLWNGNCNVKGYGLIWHEGRMRTTSRIAWFLEYGTDPGTLHVLHKCDNPSCVNPGHLFLGTHQDNMDDKMKKGRHYVKSGEDHFRSKITKAQAELIRSRLDQADRVCDIARDLGVSYHLVYDIKRRHTWN